MNMRTQKNLMTPQKPLPLVPPRKPVPPYGYKPEPKTNPEVLKEINRVLSGLDHEAMKKRAEEQENSIGSFDKKQNGKLMEVWDNGIYNLKAFLYFFIVFVVVSIPLLFISKFMPVFGAVGFFACAYIAYTYFISEKRQENVEKTEKIIRGIIKKDEK